MRLVELLLTKVMFLGAEGTLAASIYSEAALSGLGPAALTDLTLNE